MLFGPNTNLYVVSLMCSPLNKHLPKGRKLDPSAPTQTLISTIQSMAEGHLLDDEIMEDVLFERHDIPITEEDLM